MKANNQRKVCILCDLPIEGVDYWVADLVKNGDSFTNVYVHLGEKSQAQKRLKEKWDATANK